MPRYLADEPDFSSLEAERRARGEPAARPYLAAGIDTVVACSGASSAANQPPVGSGEDPGDCDPIV